MELAWEIIAATRLAHSRYGERVVEKSSSVVEKELCHNAKPMLDGRFHIMQFYKKFTAYYAPHSIGIEPRPGSSRDKLYVAYWDAGFHKYLHKIRSVEA